MHDGVSLADKRRAWNAVMLAKRRGALRPASSFPCADCGRPAHDYDHHLGYAPEHRLSLQPVCRSCNVRRGYERGRRPGGPARETPQETNPIRMIESRLTSCGGDTTMATALKLLRRRRMLTQADLAEQADTSVSTVRKIEREGGRHLPYPMTMRRIATALGVEPTDVLEFYRAVGGGGLVEGAVATDFGHARPHPQRAVGAPIAHG